MKPGALLLNVSRGGVVDEAAVAEALREDRLGGAGIDVFEAEPPAGSPLLDAPNTLLTPHLGASTAEAQVAVAEEVADQVIDVLAGRSARYAVNAPLLTPETAEAIGPYLPLAEVLGKFFAQFARTGVRTLTLEIAGEPAQHDADCSRPLRRSESTWSTPALSPRPAASPLWSAGPARPIPTRLCSPSRARLPAGSRRSPEPS